MSKEDDQKQVEKIDLQKEDVEKAKKKGGLFGDPVLTIE